MVTTQNMKPQVDAIRDMSANGVKIFQDEVKVLLAYIDAQALVIEAYQAQCQKDFETIQSLESWKASHINVKLNKRPEPDPEMLRKLIDGSWESEVEQ